MIRLVFFTLGAVGVAVAVFLFAWNMDDERDPLTILRAEEHARFEEILPRAEAGDPKAEAAVGDFYRLGKGVARDPVEAVEWYERAAKRGHIGAQYMLGRMYDTGDGIRRDYYRAAEWYGLAARLGADAEARFRLGQLYFNGRGVPHDFEKATELYRKAAEAGHPAAQFLMGAMYEDGWGVDRDYIRAYMWYVLASRQADKALAYDSDYNAPEALEKLKKKMNRFQLQRGREAVEAWQPRVEAAPIESIRK